jgi:hypothetical protein
MPIENGEEFHPEGEGPDHNDWDNGDKAVITIATTAAVGGCIWFSACRGAISRLYKKPPTVKT